MSMSIKADIKKAQKKVNSFNKGIMKDAANSINKTATASRRSLVNEFKKETGAKKKNIRRLLPIKRADGRNPKKLFAVISIFGKPLSLLALSTQVKKFGKGLQVKAAKQRRFIQGGFVATMPSGHKGIFKRNPGAKRLSIHELKVKANPEIFKDEGLSKKEEAKNEKILFKLFNQALIKRSRKFNL